MKLIFLLNIILIFSFSQIFAQKGIWESYTTSNSGLPFDNINSITVDKQGNIWCGTNFNGNYPHLAKYDGENWNGDINSSWVNSIALAPNGNIWITTNKSSLLEWKSTFWKIYNSDLFNFLWAEPLHIDSTGIIWFAADTTILRFDGKNWSAFYPANTGMPFQKITSISSTGKNIWFATQNNGLINFDGTNWKNLNDTSFISSLNIDALTSLGDTLFIVFHDGTIEFFIDSTNYNSHFVKFSSGYTSQITSDRYGNLWIATNDGIYAFSLTSEREILHYDKTNSPLPTDQITCIAADSSGNIWFGTIGNGLFKYTPFYVSVESAKQLSSGSILSPNPCSGELSIQLNLTQNNYVIISIADIMGRDLKILSNSYLDKGSHSLFFNIANLPDGIYILRFTSDNFSLSKKMILLK